MKLVSRGDTTVVDAYLSPILRRYVAQVEADLRGERDIAPALAETEASLEDVARARYSGKATTRAELSAEGDGYDHSDGDGGHDRAISLQFMQSSGGLT